MDNLNNYECVETEGIITFKNINTTLGFARYNEMGEIEYIFVNPIFRRKGLAKKLIKIIEKKIGKKPIPQEPISPLGKKLFQLQ
ncbi:GNAT family N-acetyltransferase [Candidatus Pelagibacter sp. RS40]|uniref:GNAT family N-acetyltransferase n=1 Tax=Candidatus Pelagibacter sp. RS40 TaxID=1977865 RepID=UPI000A14FD5D|nr:GNAT family N-acetyltransferase [Candidatus Pelagibacter sp. RS40]ARJ48591.1 GNAT family N-acetyltransferase [Candidatus Pelagibacter sp. RS40]